MIRHRPGKIALACLSAFLIAGSGSPQTPVRPEKWARPVPAKALKNFYKVDDGLYRSKQPGREGFEEARSLGIRAVLNLRKYHSDERLVRGLGLSLSEVRMSAGGFGEAEIVAALRAIREAPKPVLVHCQHGADRTGVVLAMYRVVFQGWAKDEAVAELTLGGYGFHSRYRNIPAFILNADVEKIRAQIMGRAAHRPGFASDGGPAGFPFWIPAAGF